MAAEGAENSVVPDAVPRKRSVADRRFVHPRRDTQWFGLSPRPASSHGRSSRMTGTGEDPGEIGRAITSDSGGGTRRRSRSLSNLDDIAALRAGARRRSDEIRYWRESFNVGLLSPLSSNAPGADDNDAGMGDTSLPESPVVERAPRTPPQPFNFGNIPNEMAGMKITQAASLDGRIGGLESRVHHLERTVHRVCHSLPGFKIHESQPHDKAEAPSSREHNSDLSSFVFTSAVPPTIPAVYQNPDHDVANSSRYSSSRPSLEMDSRPHALGEPPTSMNSLQPPTSAVPPANPSNRPFSNSTIRGATSLPAMGREATSENTDDYANLLAQLEAERVARRALEAQVKKLSERLNGLSTTMYAMVRDPAKSRSQEHLQLPVSPVLPSKTSSSQLQAPTIPRPLKALSVFETDDDSDADKAQQRSGHSDRDDDYPSDDFQTPQEERPRYGAFGEELRDDDEDEGDDVDPKRRKAARTLSLSQLTVGKGRTVQI